MSSGIVVKVWNIKGTSASKSAKEQMSDSIGYILNAEKTEITTKMDTLDQLSRECKYVENDLKTFSGAYVGGYNIASTDIKKAVGEMMEVKRFFSKLDGRAALHMIISLPEEESSVENAPKLMQLCQDVLKDVFPNNQAIFAVHTNTENLHIHVIVNSVGLDGKKIHQNDSFIKKVLQPSINKYARNYGFTENNVWNQKNPEDLKNSFSEIKMQLRNAIDLAIENADDFDGFLLNLHEQGIVTRLGKHLSLKMPGMEKAIRTHNLGNNYTKDAIVEKIVTKKEKMTLRQIGASYSVMENKKDIFNPNIVKMKKYKDMTSAEKKAVLKQLKLGRNPWRESQQRNWQLNNIANDLNTMDRVREYVKYYSDDGSIENAMDHIVALKKQIENDKKMVSYAKRKYFPILKIYNEMKSFERKAYLYDYCGVKEYRVEFEQYRELTRRLKNNYGKDVNEVSEFLNECDERILYAHSQLNELSLQYRELKRYAVQHGIKIDEKDNLEDVIGFSFQNNSAIIDLETIYVSSAETGVTLKVQKGLGINQYGQNYQSFNISVMNSNGRIIDQISNENNDSKSFCNALRSIKDTYNLTDCKRFNDYSTAERFSRRNDKIVDSNILRQIGAKQEKTYSFSQSINHVNDDNRYCVIANSNNPSYIAISQKKDSQLNVKIINRYGQLQEMVNLPLVNNKTDSGYSQIMKLQQKYGFSDNMQAFENEDDAKKYIAEKEHSTNQRKQIL